MSSPPNTVGGIAERTLGAERAACERHVPAVRHQRPRQGRRDLRGSAAGIEEQSHPRGVLLVGHTEQAIGPRSPDGHAASPPVYQVTPPARDRRARLPRARRGRLARDQRHLPGRGAAPSGRRRGRAPGGDLHRLASTWTERGRADGQQAGAGPPMSRCPRAEGGQHREERRPLPAGAARLDGRLRGRGRLLGSVTTPASASSSTASTGPRLRRLVPLRGAPGAVAAAGRLRARVDHRMLRDRRRAVRLLDRGAVTEISFSRKEASRTPPA